MVEIEVEQLCLCCCLFCVTVLLFVCQQNYSVTFGWTLLADFFHVAGHFQINVSFFLEPDP
jgi:hypothetical protein